MIATVTNFGMAIDNSYSVLRKVYPIVGDLIVEDGIYKEADTSYIVEPVMIKWTMAVIMGSKYEFTRAEYNANADVATWKLTRQPRMGDSIYKHGIYTHELKVESDVAWYARVNKCSTVFRLNQIHRYPSGVTVWNLVYAKVIGERNECR